MRRGAQVDRRKEVCGRAEAPGHEKDHKVWDLLLGEGMYGRNGVKRWASTSGINRDIYEGL